MRINRQSYQNYINKINKKYKGEILFPPVLLNEETLVFPFRDLKDEQLVVSIDGKSPLLYVINSDNFYSSFENKSLDKFKKILGVSKINNISLNENDNIVKINLTLIEKEFDEDNVVSLIVELIPLKANAYITKDGEVIEAFYKSKIKSLNNGDKYILPIQEKLTTSGIEINNKVIKNHYENELKIRNKEKYRDFRHYLVNKIKTANKKKEAIYDDVNKAQENLKLKDLADSLFTYNLNLKSHQKEINVDGKKIDLDERKTILENIESFYKKHRKARETLLRSEENLTHANKELEIYNELLERFNNANNEKECDKIILESGLNKKKKEVKETIFNRPYKLNLNGTIIYFGRNASQNDYLSFVKKLSREYTWLHIKNKSGAHIIICNNKPTENELITASEIALICSRSNAGEVIYTKKKNVRRGHTLGEAILKNYSSIKINNVREETKQLFKKSERDN